MKAVLEAAAVGITLPATAFVLRSIDNGAPTAPATIEFVGAGAAAMMWFAMNRWAPHLRGAGWAALVGKMRRDQEGKR